MCLCVGGGGWRSEPLSMVIFPISCPLQYSSVAHNCDSLGHLVILK